LNAAVSSVLRLDLAAGMVKDCRSRTSSTTASDDMKKDRIQREVTWFGGLLLAGLVILPLSIYMVGRAVFGDYGGGGLGDFYEELLGRLVRGEPVVWFLLLSPYLLWQLCRLTIWGFRRGGRRQAPTH
jgi:hypothetical protein